MIDRYALSPMKEIWTEESKFKHFLEVELAILKAKNVYVTSEININIDRIKEIEKLRNHDIIAFVESVTEQLTEKEALYFHNGITSSDIIDTGLSLMINKSRDIIYKRLIYFYETLKYQAFDHKETICMGRSHGIHANITTFGLKLLSFLSELKRNIERVDNAFENIRVGKISGAVGTYATVSPETEEKALSYLNLKRCEVSTQVIPRDLHAELLNSIAITASGIERIALEIRHLQRTEVGEVKEYFGNKQRGSSAMPHKMNPIVSERLCGLSRLLRSNASVSYENIPLWHERDISHSSVERVILPNSLILFDYMIFIASNLVSNLIIDKKRMMKNTQMNNNLHYSQQAMILLTKSGLSQTEAYDKIQEFSFKSISNDLDFVEVYNEYAEKNNYKLLDYDLNYYLKQINEIFERLK